MFWVRRIMWDYESGCIEPLTEVYEDEDEIIIRVDMPFVEDKSDIKINVSEQSVSIEARVRRVIHYEKWGTFQREIKFFKYTKRMNLPSRVDPEAAKARFKSGILEIKLPKRERSFTIPIE
ncbi:MAG: Hsp20/alpha crystallin family protein [Candidatus Methanomethyliaceae archaeon]|nr:Hsp20/alpha crystallin family protein [Candidatus Methanomethyliaceae archaeon]MCX8169487.1 Hsp20/alpha crystallin family protein [Candidatus Methanomethyliaceae archaeon]MDW7971060.1 Hsp20/alpha crystallin family protein [Nitrososphaerota archaeon]